MRELIVVARRDAGLKVRGGSVPSAETGDVDPLADILADEDVSMRPLFGPSEERVRQDTEAAAAAEGTGGPPLETFYAVDAPDERLDELAERLAALDVVDAAYVKPPAELPAVAVEPPRINDMLPSTDAPPSTTPDYTSRQIYLDAAPVGVDARHAWTMAGGRGEGVNIIDLEWGWRFTHEDLTQVQGGIVAGTGSTELRSENHGTAVIGVISGDRNAHGIVGICPEAHVSAVAFSMPSATAIRTAADRLRAGDIMLLEIHRAGPRHNFQGRDDQQGYIAIEWWPDDFAAIRYAVGRGVIVVEAAGNGRENLDDAIYDTRPSGFPTDWRNPFNPSNPTSDAVLVGAGNPPSPTHGRTVHPGWGETYVDRARCGFSNHGRRVDCQGHGWEVTTTGYGDLQGGGNRDLWYTDTFSGTSSASPVVTGALGCVQGVLRAQGAPLLTPARARELLRSTGSPQQAGTSPDRPVTQRIGNRPNLRQLLGVAARSWYSGVRVSQTYATHHSANAWAHFDGHGWRRIEAGSADGITNMLILLSEAEVKGKPVTIYADGSSVFQAYL